MQDIDEQIRKALTEEDQKAIAEIDRGAGLFELISLGFKGKQAWMMYYMYALGFIAFVIGLYFVNQYMNSNDLKTSLSWALAIIACLFILSLVKFMVWLQMLKLELLREIKRLEMRIMLAREESPRQP